MLITVVVGSGVRIEIMNHSISPTMMMHIILLIKVLLVGQAFLVLAAEELDVGFAVGGKGIGVGIQPWED